MLEMNASLKSVDKRGRTALHYLVENDISGDLTEWLISLKRNDLDVNAASIGGHTPLMTAVKKNRTKVVSELLKAGANPLFKNACN